MNSQDTNTSEEPKPTLWNQRLNAALKTQETLAVYLNNGVKLRGIVTEFDYSSILLSSTTEGGVLVERHSIASIKSNSQDIPERRPSPNK